MGRLMTAPAVPLADADDTKVLAEIARLQKKVAGLEAEVATEQRRNFELTQALATARDFADSDAHGHIDRTELEA